MHRATAKIHLILAQMLSFTPLLEVWLLKSAYSMLIAVPVIMALNIYRCQVCKTPLWDERIIGRKVPVSPTVLDDCKVCEAKFLKD